MEMDDLANFRNRLVRLIDSDIVISKSVLWKFWLYYFVKENKKLKRNEIGEIEDFLAGVDIPREDFKLLDEEITSFFIGYHIISEFKRDDPFRDKYKKIESELEKHWNATNSCYFGNDLYTLMLLVFHKDDIHIEQIMKKFEKTNNCSYLLLIFKFLEKSNRESELKRKYNEFLNRVKEKYYAMRNSDKIYVSWILWEYRKKSDLKIKEVREIISNCIYINENVLTELKDGYLNFGTPIYYDLLINFYGNIIIASEEFPKFFKILAGFSAAMLMYFAWMLLLRIPLINNNSNLNFVIHIVFSTFAFLLLITGLFLIYEIIYKNTFTDEEVLLKYKNFMKNRFVDTFLFGGIIVTIFLNIFL